MGSNLAQVRSRGLLADSQVWFPSGVPFFPFGLTARYAVTEHVSLVKNGVNEGVTIYL